MSKTNPIQNHPGQSSVWFDDARFKVIVAGRRWGKTIYLREQLLMHGSRPGKTAIYVGPTRMQAKDIIWDTLKARVLDLGWQCQVKEAELALVFPQQSRIEIKSAEKPGRLRGRGIDYIGLDEFAEYRSNEIWTQVVRPALSDRRGKADFAMTPKGYNHGYDLFNEAKTEDNWSAHAFKTLDSPFFQTPEGRAEIAEAKRNLSERDFRQEYEASFENFAGRVYYGFDRERCNDPTDYVPGQPVIVGMDFNKHPMTSACFQKKGTQHLHQFDEIYLESSDTPEMCRALRQRYPDSNIIVRPDATGARSYSVNKNLSDHVIIRQHGFTVQSANTNPSRVDRWASVNRAHEKGWVTVNVKKCPRTVKDLEVISFKEGSCEPMLNDKMLGHISDGHGYAVYREFPIIGKAMQTHYA